MLQLLVVNVYLTLFVTYRSWSALYFKHFATISICGWTLRRQFYILGASDFCAVAVCLLLDHLWWQLIIRLPLDWPAPTRGVSWKDHNYWAAVGSSSILSPISEEMVYRGLLLVHFPTIPALLLGALLFSAMHIRVASSRAQLLGHFGFGLLAGLLYLEAQGNLVPCILFHMLGNMQLDWRDYRLRRGYFRRRRIVLKS